MHILFFYKIGWQKKILFEICATVKKINTNRWRMAAVAWIGNLSVCNQIANRKKITND